MRKRFSRHFSCWNLIKKINLWTFDSRRDKNRAHHSDSVSHSQVPTLPLRLSLRLRLRLRLLLRLLKLHADFDRWHSRCCRRVKLQTTTISTAVAAVGNATWSLHVSLGRGLSFRGGKRAQASATQGDARAMQLQDAGLSCSSSCVPHELQVSAINLFQHEFNSHRVLSECSLLTSFHFPVRFTSFLLRQQHRDFTNSFMPSSSLSRDACVHLSVGSAL